MGLASFRTVWKDFEASQKAASKLLLRETRKRGVSEKRPNSERRRYPPGCGLSASKFKNFAEATFGWKFESFERRRTARAGAKKPFLCERAFDQSAKAVVFLDAR
jgi:hypothetical protein